MKNDQAIASVCVYLRPSLLGAHYENTSVFTVAVSGMDKAKHTRQNKHTMSYADNRAYK